MAFAASPNYIPYPLKKEKQKFSFFYYLIILLFIFNISQASVLNNSLILNIVGVPLLLIHFIYKKKFYKKFIYIIIIWFAICLIASVLLTDKINIVRILNYTMFLLIVPYITINLIGIKFWEKFEKVVYILTFISLPLYILNSLFKSEFNNLWIIFRPITSESFGKTYPYWTALIYVNAIYDPYFNLVRNCGFMWEPGAFAMMIIFAAVYNLRTNGNKLSFKIFIYLIALITTFSTAGYLAIIFVFLSIYLKKLSIPNGIMILVLVVFYYSYVYKLGFVSQKLDAYVVGYQENELRYDDEGGYIKVNRLRAVYYALQDAIKCPTGYGVVKKSDISESEVEIYGTNGLGSLLVLWGFPMLVYCLIMIRRFISVIVDTKSNILSFNFMYVALLIMFFSNPISQSLLVYLIFFTPIIFGKHITSNIQSPSFQ